MKLLLDTHAFIWMNAAPEKLSPRVRALCERGADAFFLSLVSAWEMQIKQQLGKLQLSPTAGRMIETNISANNIALLPITLAHVRQLDSLPLHHRDPFDRMLIAQAQLEDMALVSADGKFADYPLDVIW
jgi:PIN domain nuclease of toxin-antitoxin system